MKHLVTVSLSLLSLAVAWASPAWAAPQLDEVIRDLDKHESVAGNERIKSYKILFDAYLELSDPPFEFGEVFNQNTIHPGMPNWSTVAGWAESNPGMADAVLQASQRVIVGLPYGTTSASQAYIDAGLVVNLGDDDTLQNIEFPYLDALDIIACYVVAESFRLCEAGQTEKAMELGISHIYVLRQFCDRQFLDEKMYSILLVIDSLRNLRDQFYMYRDEISIDVFIDIGQKEIPFLRPDRRHLKMPEGDRIVAEALLRSVFDENSGTPDADRFAETFAKIQAQNAPLTRFGAAKRWKQIALIHDSLSSSLERLQLVYDDWWRRWRVQEYDVILDIPTQFEVTNPVRYAAVIYSMRDIEDLFGIRNLLIAEVNGTAVAAGLCAYEKYYDGYPDNQNKIYGQFLRRSTDKDPFDQQFDVFRFRRLSSRQSIDTRAGRVWVEPAQAVLWSLGEDNANGQAETHTNDASEGDVVIWPPVKVLSREQGLLP